jgi:hypothetical protein
MDTPTPDRLTPAGVALPPPPPRREPGGPWRSPEEDRQRRSGRVAIAAIVVLAVVGAAIGTVVGTGTDPRRAEIEANHDFAFLRELPNGAPFRWDPCTPIHYEVNVQDAPGFAVRDVRAAIVRTSQASGFRFVFDGTTTRTVDQQIGRAFQTGSTEGRWLPVLIEWVPHSHFDFLVDTSHAAAFGMPYAGDGSDFATYESGVVAVDAGGDLSAGFGWRFSDGVVLMHELGHVLGLGHVAAGDEVMWSPEVAGSDGSPDTGVTTWGPGDLHGLEILGRHGSCPSSN